MNSRMCITIREFSLLVKENVVYLYHQIKEMKQPKIQPINDIDFINKYGITMPSNTTERDIEIWNQLAYIQEQMRLGATQVEVYEYAENLKEYIYDTQHVSAPLLPQICLN